MNNTEDAQLDDYNKNYNKRNEELLNELLDLPYDEILKKHNKTEFFNDVFDRAIDGDVVLLGRLIADDFLPAQDQQSAAPTKLNPTQNETIIKILAEDQTQNPTEVLKQIQAVLPGAVLPQSFDWTDYHNRSVKIYNATLSLKAVLAEYDAVNYENEVKAFLKFTPEQINELLAEEEKISLKLQKEYDNLLAKGTPPNLKVLNESIVFLGKIGRSLTQTNALKEKKNLGIITEIILKAERAMKISLDIKKSNASVATEEDLLMAIAHHLLDNTHL